MSRIVLTMQMSLDGIVSDVERWMTLSDEIVEDALEYYHTLDAIIVGGYSYASLAQYWQQAEQTSASALERAFAQRINGIKKYVLSRTPVYPAWNNTEQLDIQDRPSLIRAMEQLRQREGRSISVESGAKTWQLLIRDSLFDDLWVFVHPVVAAQGERLFADAAAKLPLRLKDSKIYRNGVVGLYYETTSEES